MPRPTEWQALIDAPAPAVPTGRREKPELSKEERAAVQRQLWTAVDENNPDELQRTLDEGAFFTNRREGVSPLFECVRRDRWALAELLIAAGAPVRTKTSKNLSLWSAIARRDRPEEATRLLGWGLTFAEARPEEFTAVRAGRLLLAWCQAIPGFDLPIRHKGDLDEARFLDLLHTAARGPQELRELINTHWGLDAQDPHSLANRIGTLGTRKPLLPDFWESLFQQDSVELSRTCIAAGWAPMATSGFFLGGQPLAWQMMHHRAWRMLEWWLSVPEFLQETLDSARTSPDKTWWLLAQREGSVGLLKRLQAMGIDLSSVNEQGENVAHLMFQSFNLNKGLVDWFVQQQPSLLSQLDQAGRTPLRAGLDKKANEEAPRLIAHAQAALLSRKVAPPDVKPAAARARL